MSIPTDLRAVVAVDLGAQSCRVSLLRWLPDGPRIELVHRVSNGPIERHGELRWDLAAITAAADEGLRRCAAIAKEGIAAIGVAGWAVDYVRLKPGAAGAAMEPIEDPFCYRDSRTGPAMEAVHQRISATQLYSLTGIQVLPINTLYQLYADGTAGVPADLPWLNLPEYMLYRWGARPVAEYTNATHTGMVELGTLRWSQEIFSPTGLDPAAAPEIVPPGTVVGQLKGPLAGLPALRDTLLIAPACHDTAAAIAGIPAEGNDWAYISSGTWSLVGTLLEKPCAGTAAAKLNFTNEGGVGGNFCFLRNVNGLWLLAQCMEAWRASGNNHDLESLLDAAAKLPAPDMDVLLDVDDPELLAPGNMPERIMAQLAKRNRAGAEIKNYAPAMVNLILRSLAARYAEVLRQAETLTGKHFSHLYIVGGGSKNVLLNQLTQQATGLKVLLGAQESSTVGNFSVQLATLEKFDQISTNRDGAEQDAVARWAKVLFGSVLNTEASDAVQSTYAAQSIEEGNK